MISKFPNISEQNYRKVDMLIENQKNTLNDIEETMKSALSKLEAAEDIYSTMEKVMGGTYVQSLVADERDRRETDIIPNGLKQV